MNSEWLSKFLGSPGLSGMGHGQSVGDLNLGMGWLYYAFARAYRPKRVICIGSYRGFAPILFAKSMNDNATGGEVTFIDPSFVDSFWLDSQKVRDYFLSFGVNNIHHFLGTTQKFVEDGLVKRLGAVDFLFIDGYHSAEQAQFDHESFQEVLSENHLVFFHDSLSAACSEIYGSNKSYNYSVFEYINKLRGQQYQIFDIGIENGLTILQKKQPSTA